MPTFTEADLATEVTIDEPSQEDFRADAPLGGDAWTATVGRILAETSMDGEHDAEVAGALRALLDSRTGPPGARWAIVGGGAGGLFRYSLPDAGIAWTSATLERSQADRALPAGCACRPAAG